MAELRVERELTSSAPISDVWAVASDFTSFAGCIPLAEPTWRDGMRFGALEMDVRGLRKRLHATVRQAEVDDDAYSASLRLSLHDAPSRGVAAATLTVHLQPAGESTQVAFRVIASLAGCAASEDAMSAEINPVVDDLADAFQRALESAPPQGDAHHASERPAAHRKRNEPARRWLAPFCALAALLALLAFGASRARKSA
jgi:carbon monoxide dehydrogenase subunit G